jgi:ABC-2 type transport system permease protein
MIHAYFAYIKLALLKQIHYQAELLIWLIGRVLQPLLYLIIWSTVADANAGSVDTFTAGDFAAYFIAEMLVNYATYTAVMWEYEYRVRNGALSAMLLRPLHPIHADLAETLANKLLNFLVILPTTVLLVLTFKPTLHLNAWTMLTFVPALLLAFALRFLIEWILAMAAFWTTRVSAINAMYFAGMLFLSGQMTPLALLPAPIQTLATFLPFRWVIAFPIELFLGRLTSREVGVGIAMQAGWLFCMLILLTYVWRLGIRRYSAVGA